MNTTGDIKTEFLIRVQGDTSVGFYTDTILNNWLNMAHKMAAGYHKWPFTEGRSSTTWASSTEEWPYPEGYRTDSIRYLEIGDKKFEKITFEDYQRFKQNNASSADKVFSDFGRVLFVNTLADVSGTMTVYGQYNPADLDPSDPTTQTIFSNNEEEGNEALVYEMISYTKIRQNKLNDAQLYHARALQVLEKVWEKIQNEQYGYQMKDRGQFERFDVLFGLREDEIFRRDQFPL